MARTVDLSKQEIALLEKARGAVVLTLCAERFAMPGDAKLAASRLRKVYVHDDLRRSRHSVHLFFEGLPRALITHHPYEYTYLRDAHKLDTQVGLIYKSLLLIDDLIWLTICA